MKQLYLYAFVFFLLFYILPSAYAEVAAGNASRDDMRSFHLYNDVDMISTLKISYDKPRIVIHAVFPQLKTEEENEAITTFNSVMNELIQDEINRFKNYIAQSQIYQQQLSKNKIKNDLYIDYDASIINIKNQHIASIRLTMQGLASGVNQNYRYHRVVNYDLVNNQKLELADLFDPDTYYLSVLSRFTADVLMKRLGQKQMILYGTGASKENFQNWNIKPRGLLITFDPHQIGTVIHGTQTVFVPFSMLRGMLSHSSPLGSCFYKKQCVSKNVLTGGFIDEAVNTRHRRLNPIFG